MLNSNKSCQGKCKCAEQQAPAGKESITIVVDDWLKKVIAEECKRADCTVSDVITKSVVSFVDFSAT